MMTETITMGHIVWNAIFDEFGRPIDLEFVGFSRGFVILNEAYLESHKQSKLIELQQEYDSKEIMD